MFLTVSFVLRLVRRASVVVCLYPRVVTWGCVSCRLFVLLAAESSPFGASGSRDAGLGAVFSRSHLQELAFSDSNGLPSAPTCLEALNLNPQARLHRLRRQGLRDLSWDVPHSTTSP